jgi:hypothetical protein
MDGAERQEVMNSYLNDPDSVLKFRLYKRDNYVGIITISRQDRHIELDEDAKPEDVPYLMRDNFKNGERVFDDAGWFGKWIRNRVVPPNRDNIDEILEDVGISHYDPYALFIFASGGYNLDGYWIGRTT